MPKINQSAESVGKCFPGLIGCAFEGSVSNSALRVAGKIKRCRKSALVRATWRNQSRACLTTWVIGAFSDSINPINLEPLSNENETGSVRYRRNWVTADYSSLSAVCSPFFLPYWEQTADSRCTITSDTSASISRWSRNNSDWCWRDSQRQVDV